jgi:hypothetical protein
MKYYLKNYTGSVYEYTNCISRYAGCNCLTTSDRTYIIVGNADIKKSP